MDPVKFELEFHYSFQHQKKTLKSTEQLIEGKTENAIGPFRKMTKEKARTNEFFVDRIIGFVQSSVSRSQTYIGARQIKVRRKDRIFPRRD